jgi:putrescine:ornithine antiporter
MKPPITGMIVLGAVQTILALMTISPTLNEQFSALVNLSVVTNVVATTLVMTLTGLPVVAANVVAVALARRLPVAVSVHGASASVHGAASGRTRSIAFSAATVSFGAPTNRAVRPQSGVPAEELRSLSGAPPAPCRATQST